VNEIPQLATIERDDMTLPILLIVR